MVLIQRHTTIDYIEFKILQMTMHHIPMQLINVPLHVYWQKYLLIIILYLIVKYMILYTMKFIINV